MFQLFDPFDLSLKAVANVDSEPRVFGIEDVPLGATFEGIGVSFDEVFESGDPSVELPHFGPMVGFSLFDRFE